MFPLATIYFTPLIYILSLIAALYASFNNFKTSGFKKKLLLIHQLLIWGFVTIGLFTLNTQGVEGSILLMLSHGLVSSALFLCVGILYDRYKN